MKDATEVLQMLKNKIISAEEEKGTLVTPTMYDMEKMENKVSFAILERVDSSPNAGVYKRFTVTVEDMGKLKK